MEARAWEVGGWASKEEVTASVQKSEPCIGYPYPHPPAYPPIPNGMGGYGYAHGLVGSNDDVTTDNYIDRILFQLTLAVEDSIPVGHCRIASRHPSSPPPATSSTDYTLRATCLLVVSLSFTSPVPPRHASKRVENQQRWRYQLLTGGQTKNPTHEGFGERIDEAKVGAYIPTTHVGGTARKVRTYKTLLVGGLEAFDFWMDIRLQKKTKEMQFRCCNSRKSPEHLAFKERRSRRQGSLAQVEAPHAISGDGRRSRTRERREQAPGDRDKGGLGAGRSSAQTLPLALSCSCSGRTGWRSRRQGRLVRLGVSHAAKSRSALPSLSLARSNARTKSFASLWSDWIDAQEAALSLPISLSLAPLGRTKAMTRRTESPRTLISLLSPFCRDPAIPTRVNCRKTGLLGGWIAISCDLSAVAARGNWNLASNSRKDFFCRNLALTPPIATKTTTLASGRYLMACPDIQMEMIKEFAAAVILLITESEHIIHNRMRRNLRIEEEIKSRDEREKLASFPRSREEKWNKLASFSNNPQGTEHGRGQQAAAQQTDTGNRARERPTGSSPANTQEANSHLEKRKSHGKSSRLPYLHQFSPGGKSSSPDEFALEHSTLPQRYLDQVLNETLLNPDLKFWKGMGKANRQQPNGHKKQGTEKPTGHGKANRQQPTGNRAREGQQGTGEANRQQPNGHRKQGTGRPTGSSPQEIGHGRTKAAAKKPNLRANNRKEAQTESQQQERSPNREPTKPQPTNKKLAL
ncbi:hypothetical protein M5K25_018907 [Dendrobium thyrsiflorum]|uniref:Uncharacterized protein n=1 Tax=Dendrobium thyrsiflorum TaxID=117978 RepID=A0ABD0UDN2_DENTH